jgi:hypothetical protein
VLLLQCDCSALWLWAATESYFLLPTEKFVFEIQDWGGVVVGVDDNLADVFKLRLICLVG